MFWDEAMLTYLYKMRCQRVTAQKTGDYGPAFTTGFEAISKDQRISEIWMELAGFYFEVKEWKRCIGMCMCAIQPIYKSTLWIEQNAYTDRPWRLMSFSWEFLGNRQMAIECVNEVLKIAPNDQDMINRRNYLMGVEQPKNYNKEIHLLRPGALGDILMTLWPLEAYKRKNPDTKIYYYCAPQYHEFLKSISSSITEVRHSDVAPNNAIRLIGYPLKEGYPNEPMKKHLIEYFGDELGISKEEAWVKWKPNFENFFKDDKKYLVIHCTAGWSPYKNYPVSKFQLIVNRIKLNYPDLVIIEIGEVGQYKLKSVEHIDIRSQEARSAVICADLFLGVDSWPNHLRGVVGKPSIILWGSTSPIGSGYETSTNIWLGCIGGFNQINTKYSRGLSPCYREDPIMTVSPKNPPECPFIDKNRHPDVWNAEEGHHPCMNAISVDVVFEQIKKHLDNING